MTTGERIRQLRIEHQMTQEELGAKVGVQKAAIYKYENGLVVNLKRSILEKLALVLDTTPTYLMGMEDAEPAHASLTPAQTALLDNFNQLNEEGQTKTSILKIVSARYANTCTTAELSASTKPKFPLEVNAEKIRQASTITAPSMHTPM